MIRLDWAKQLSKVSLCMVANNHSLMGVRNYHLWYLEIKKLLSPYKLCTVLYYVKIFTMTFKCWD